MRSSRGVTLIELMVTMSVAALLMVVAAPSFTAIVYRIQLRTTTNELQLALATARSEAIKRGAAVTVCKSATTGDAEPTCISATTASWRDGWLTFVDNNGNGVREPSGTNAEKALRIGNASAESAVITPDANFSQYLTYLPSGASKGNGGQPAGGFTVCLHGQGRRVEIGTTGHARVTESIC